MHKLSDNSQETKCRTAKAEKKVDTLANAREKIWANNTCLKM
jgi:hypothetical protein